MKKIGCDHLIMEQEAATVVKRSRSRVKDLQGLFSRGGREEHSDVCVSVGNSIAAISIGVGGILV